MKRMDDQDLDRLLGQAPPPDAPAWFAAKTMARLRREEDARGSVGWWGWLMEWTAGHQLAVAAAAAVVVLLSVLVLFQPNTTSVQGQAPMAQVAEAPQPASVSFTQQDLYAAFEALEAADEESITWNESFSSL